ncbi:hypothetical protein BT96DRAFT_943089 [Gymnopus androsaceus JB14]|uniref:Uncharacterized protein n=1 Tax=Gymnopus androsaceus JB14 TaxID=1447944 RepID=A0A6A4H9Z5_9AGAR|nr:hypothetical protein BT96DRAFT_943089 [Gymnopus androsaceus JB14]
MLFIYTLKICNSHNNPITWHGDVQVQNIILMVCWKKGRETAEKQLQKAGIKPPFEKMEREGSYDILCPFGMEKVLLVNDLSVGEDNEGDNETHDYNGQVAPVPPISTENQFPPNSPPLSDFTDSELEPKIEDTAAEKESKESKSQKYSAWVADTSKGTQTSKMIHKSSVLRIFSSPLYSPDSTDRIWRPQASSKVLRIWPKVLGCPGCSGALGNGQIPRLPGLPVGIPEMPWDALKLAQHLVSNFSHTVGLRKLSGVYLCQRSYVWNDLEQMSACEQATHSRKFKQDIIRDPRWRKPSTEGTMSTWEYKLGLGFTSLVVLVNDIPSKKQYQGRLQVPAILEAKTTHCRHQKQ